jgi:hypothetical protein
MSTQAHTSRCECGAVVAIRPTVSLWEFEYACIVCRRGGVISWAHSEPPPAYEPPSMKAQMPLFEGPATP